MLLAVDFPAVASLQPRIVQGCKLAGGADFGVVNLLGRGFSSPWISWGRGFSFVWIFKGRGFPGPWIFLAYGFFRVDFEEPWISKPWIFWAVDFLARGFPGTVDFRACGFLRVVDFLDRGFSCLWIFCRVDFEEPWISKPWILGVP